MSRTGKRPKAHSGPHSRSKGNVPMHALMKVLVIATLAYATTTLAQSQDKVATIAAHSQLNTSCMACHRQHRQMGPGGRGPGGPPPGGPGPGRGGPPPGGGPGVPPEGPPPK